MVHFPFSWAELTEEESLRLKTDFPSSMVNDLVRHSNGILMPRAFTAIAEEIYNFQVRENDVWVVTYPRSGTTWAQEMMWMIINDLDKNKSQAIPRDPLDYMETMEG